MNRFGKPFAAALIAAGVTSASAAAEEAVGAYYNVSVDILKDQNAATSGSGQLLVYSRDNGTTAVQLLVQAEPDTVGFVLHRETTPDVAGEIFGSIDDLVISYRPMNRPRDITDNQAFDLLKENGRPLGDTFQLFDASGEPLTNIQLTYSAQGLNSAQGPNISTTPTTGTARVLPGGNIYIPKSPVTQQTMYYNRVTYRLSATEPDTGATIKDINSRTHHQIQDEVTSLTLPFLNDWDTTATGVDIYTGQILRDAGTPAANVQFTLMAMMYRDSSDQFDQGMMHRGVVTGPDGRFKLAFKQPQTKTHSGNPHVQLQVASPGISNELHTLLPGEDTVIRARKNVDVTLQLLDEAGKQLDLRTTSPLASKSHTGVLGLIIDLSGSRNVQPLEVADRHSSSGLKPVKLNVPGSFIGLSRGYLFGPVRVDEKPVVTLKPVLADFSVTGKIIDVHGKAISGALVLVIDRAMSYELSRSDAISYALLSQLRGKSFAELGAYLVETDEAGKYELSGKSLSSSAMFYVTAPGYGTVQYSPLEQPGPGQMTDAGRLSGVYDVGTQATAREATVTLEVKKPENEEPTTAMPQMEPRLHVAINAGFVGGKSDIADQYIDRKQVWPKAFWQGEQKISGYKATLSVPAETTFTLTVIAPQMSRTENKPLQINIDKLLAPGEVRDLGPVK